MGGALSKLTWKHWAIIGAVVCVILATSLFFVLIKKQKEEIAKKEQELQATETRAAQKDSLAQQLEQAKAEKRSVEERLEVYLRTKMIPLNMTSPVDQYHTMVRLWREQAEVLGPLMERHIASTGVRLGGGGGSLALVNGQRFYIGTGGVLSVPAPPATPSAIPTSGWYMLSLGQITVSTTGGFNHALEYIRSFSRAPRLVTIGAPTITGQSPNLNVTMPIDVYYYVKGNGTAAVGGGGAPDGSPMGGPMGEPISGPPSGSGSGNDTGSGPPAGMSPGNGPSNGSGP